MVHRGAAGKLWRQPDRCRQKVRETQKLKEGNGTPSPIVTTKHPHISQASTSACCHNHELQTCIRSIPDVLQQKEQRPQRASQYQNVFEILEQPAVLAGLVTKGLLTRTQCLSNVQHDVLHKYPRKTHMGAVFCDTGTYTSVETNTWVCVRSSPRHDVLPAAHSVSMETLVFESPVVHILASMVTHGVMRTTPPICRRRPHTCRRAHTKSSVQCRM